MKEFHRQMVASVLDQMAASAATLLLVMYMARGLDPERFGGFALVSIVYALVTSINRVLCSEPLTVLSSASGITRGQLVRLTAASATTGAVGAALTWVFFTVTQLPVGAESWVLLFFLPALGASGFLRLTAVACQRAEKAAAATMLWAIVVTCSFGALLLMGQQPWAAMFVWCATAVASSLLLVSAISPVTQTATTTDVRASLALGRVPALEYIIVVGAGQSIFFMVASVMSADAVSGPRLALLLLGPVTVVASGVVQALMPRWAHHPDSMRWGVPRAQAALAAFAAAAGAALSLLPETIGRLVAGQQWEATQQAIPAMTACSVMVVMVMPALVAVRIQRLNRPLFIRRVLVAPIAPITVILWSRAGELDIAWVAVLAAGADLVAVQLSVHRGRARGRAAQRSQLNPPPSDAGRSGISRPNRK